LVSFFERQGNLRNLSESFQGDKTISFTDEEYFALTSQHTTEKQVFLVMVDKDKVFTADEMRTRWHEVDQFVRDQVSEELGFVQQEPVPGIGILYENGRPNAFMAMANGGLQTWADAGVKVLVNHAPGWYSDQHNDGWDQKRTAGGNSNRISDWRPTLDVEEPWRALSRKAGEVGIAYYAYMTGMANREKEFVAEVGTDMKHWGVNNPANDFSSGYPPKLVGHNPLDPRFYEIFTQKIENTQDNFGFQGIWADSFQNMYMSQLNWGGGDGNSTQRAWWELISKWSQRGINWMSESHGFPGWSCSIEVPGWEKDTLFFPHVWKWLRGLSQNSYSPEELDELTFRTMAAKGWIGPDLSYKAADKIATPGFERLAKEYNAALPMMRRPYIVGKEKGVLWTPFDSDSSGVFFSFTDQDLPAGIKANTILEKKAAKNLAAFQTYSVSGEDLPSAFGMRKPPLEDPRAGKEYRPNEWVWFEESASN